MSRGGRGGGGRRMPGGPSWEIGGEIDGRPSDLFPKYNVPQAQALSKIEQRQINYFLLFRRQVHDSPLYTRKYTTVNDTLKPRRTYGQEQVNKRYSTKSKATVDPFIAIETYSQRFVEEERTLPDFSSQPFCKEMFPSEIHDTLDGNDCAPSQRRQHKEKRLELSKVTSLHTADELYRSQNGDDAAARVKALAANLADGDDELGDGHRGEDDDEHGSDDDEEEDHEYDDEDGGDYDAEAYFDDGDDDDMDDGGDDNEAVY
ncbi:uncharacterized protein BROUX77_002032 [Berkeleyomyces rouxiae]|uniref:uncharacterized protein n=1 Tax=Berkeleyomyces rouxiae TaxID=2035830 RepID=UPI003B790407